ncbi:MAG: hypothetical protein QGH94_05205 [Phycisphaerae bacterium]|nr:hypothetical protein [Phycisphaerae bacterium]
MSETPPPSPAPIPAAPQVSPIPAAQPPAGFAITAFVLGLCGLIPLLGMLLGLLGIVFGIIALARSCGCRLKGLAITGIVVGAVTIVVQPLLMVPAISRSVELANQASCRANLNPDFLV